MERSGNYRLMSGVRFKALHIRHLPPLTNGPQYARSPMGVVGVGGRVRCSCDGIAEDGTSVSLFPKP